MNSPAPSRDELAARYLDTLPFEPYPVQEEALLAWFTAEQGVLVCAPTGTGKTLIAEAALFEALHTGTTAYYTTPLIALTEQKFREMQELAVRWGFAATDIGLVTGNRRENADARILVVVAEILLNRLLHGEAFDFSEVSTVVMDEFHSFADRERGIVWEFSLGLLPPHVRTLLLSATVGNSVEFTEWLRESHNRRVQLIQSSERKVPLSFHWVGDQLLPEHIEQMASGDETAKRTPALVFCFDREECWSVAEQLKGKKILRAGQQDALADQLENYDWSQGAGPKLKQILQRGVGVHHAGVLPKYRRIVEDLFQKKLLSVAVCTETLSAGINLPARSVVLPTLMKGPFGKKKLIDASTAHQIFGRAGRPQYDSEGHVYALAHEDDVKIARWREKFDQIPEDTKDPGLIRAKKKLKKKMPTRRATEQYWNEDQFQKLCAAPPGKLYSKGPLSWRLLAHMLEASPELAPVRELASKRLLESGKVEAGLKALDRMVMTLWRAGYVELSPEPPKSLQASPASKPEQAEEPPPEEPKKPGLFDQFLDTGPDEKSAAAKHQQQGSKKEAEETPPYKPEQAHPTPELEKLRIFRGVNPLYGVFLVNQLGIADRAERIQAMESVLEMPGSVARHVRVPRQQELPPGPLATQRLDESLLSLGLATPEELSEQAQEEDGRRRSFYEEDRPRVLALADKLRMQFDYDFPGVHDLRTRPVWAAGELVEFGGKFNKYIVSRNLQKQEGVIFRHLLRLILLLAEFARLTPPDTTEEEWRGDLAEISSVLVEACREVDPLSTEETLEKAESADEADL